MFLHHSTKLAHKINLFVNQTILLTLYVFDSLKRTGPKEYIVCESNNNGCVLCVYFTEINSSQESKFVNQTTLVVYVITD